MSSNSILFRVVSNHPKPENQWTYFELGIKLMLSRWTALRMAIDGEWGGGDTEKKFEYLLDEILHLFKYHKNVYMDDLAMNIDEYVENAFNLVCDDGSVDEISKAMVSLAEECKTGNFSRVNSLIECHPIPLDLKSCKRTLDDDIIPASTIQYNQSIKSEQEMVLDEPDPEGWITATRKSTRKKNQPQYYDPAVEFPGAN